MKRAVVLFVIFLIVTLPIVTAFEISNVVFYDGDRAIDRFRYDETYNVRMEFDVNPEAWVTLDKSQFSPTASGRVYDECEGGHCVFEDLRLYVPPEGRFTAMLNHNDEGGQEKDFSFTQDVSEPTVAFIGPEGCGASEQCYIGPQTQDFVANFVGSSTGFGSVPILIGGSRFESISCDEDSCTYNVASFSGQQGREYDAVVVSGSTDLAGNEIMPKETPDTIVYDSRLPTLGASSYATEGHAGVVYSPGTLVLEYEVEDESPVDIFLTFTPDIEEVLEINDTAVCESSAGDAQTCRVQIELDGVRSYYATVTGYVLDAAGNRRDLRSQRIRVLEGVEGEDEPDLWEIDSQNPNPTRLNRATLGLFDKTVYNYMTLSPKQSAVTATSVDVGGCTAIGMNGTDPFGALDYIMNNQFGSVNPIVYYKFRQLMDYPDVPSVTYNCSLKIFSKRGSKFFTTPENEYYTLTLSFYESPTFADNVQEEIERVRQKQMEMQAKYGDLRENMERMLYICNSLITIETVGSTLGPVATALKTGTLTAPEGELVSKADAGIAGTASELLDKSGIYQMCQMITCTLPQQQKIKEAILRTIGFGQFDFNVEVGVDGNGRQIATLTGEGPLANLGISTFGDVSGIGENLFVDAATFCIPGILTHLKKYEAIDCGYLECLSRDAAAGFPISECVATRGYQECRFIIGEIWNAFPFTAMFSKMVDFVTTMLRDPIAIIGFVARCLCMDQSNSGFMRKLCGPIMPANSWHTTDMCQFFVQVQSITKLVGMFNSMRTIFEGPQTDTYCSEVLENINGDNEYDFTYDPTSSAHCTGNYCTLTLARIRDRHIFDGDRYRSANPDPMSFYNEFNDRAELLQRDIQLQQQAMNEFDRFVSVMGHPGTANYLLDRDGQQVTDAENFYNPEVSKEEKIDILQRTRQYEAMKRFYDSMGIFPMTVEEYQSQFGTVIPSFDSNIHYTSLDARYTYEVGGQKMVFRGPNGAALTPETIYAAYQQIQQHGGMLLEAGDFKGSKEDFMAANDLLARYQLYQLGFDAETLQLPLGSGVEVSFTGNPSDIVTAYRDSSGAYQEMLQNYNDLKTYESLSKKFENGRTSPAEDVLLDSLQRELYDAELVNDDGELVQSAKQYKNSDNFDNAKKAYKDTEKDFKELKREVSALMINMMYDENGNLIFKGGWALYKDVIDNIKGFHTVSTLVFPDQDFGAWSEGVDKFMSYLNAEEHIYSAVCDSDFDRQAADSGVVVNKEGGFLHPALHIEGERDVQETPSGTLYNYVITTQAVTHKIEDPVTVKVFVGGDLAHSQNFSTTQPLDRGKSNPIVLTNQTQMHNRACVEFSRDLEALFDWTTISGNRFCTDLLGEPLNAQRNQ